MQTVDRSRDGAIMATVFGLSGRLKDAVDGYLPEFDDDGESLDEWKVRVRGYVEEEEPEVYAELDDVMAEKFAQAGQEPPTAEDRASVLDMAWKYVAETYVVGILESRDNHYFEQPFSAGTDPRVMLDGDEVMRVVRDVDGSGPDAEGLLQGHHNARFIVQVMNLGLSDDEDRDHDEIVIPEEGCTPAPWKFVQTDENDYEIQTMDGLPLVRMGNHLNVHLLHVVVEAMNMNVVDEPAPVAPKP
jgi:hypothetical protein